MQPVPAPGFAYVTSVLIKEQEETDRSCAEQEIKGSGTSKLQVLLCSISDFQGQQKVPGFAESPDPLHTDRSKLLNPALWVRPAHRS